MKSLLKLLLPFAIVGMAKAQQLNDVVVPTQAFDTISTNYTFNGFTNATPGLTVTLNTSPVLYHTLQFYPTGVCSYVVDRTIDGTNWFAGATNAVTAGTVAEATITGKYNQMRVRIQGTNIGGGCSYLGGR